MTLAALTASDWIQSFLPPRKPKVWTRQRQKMLTPLIQSLATRDLKRGLLGKKYGKLVPPEIEQNWVKIPYIWILNSEDFVRRSMKYNTFSFRRVSERFHLLHLIDFSFGLHSRTKCLLPAQHTGKISKRILCAVRENMIRILHQSTAAQLLYACLFILVCLLNFILKETYIHNPGIAYALFIP